MLKMLFKKIDISHIFDTGWPQRRDNRGFGCVFSKQGTQGEVARK